MVSDQIRAAMYVEKGGVGKTTSASHLAVALHEEHDLDTLLIDLAGRQNDLATQFGLREATEDIDAPISAVFGEQWDFIRSNIDDVVDRMTFATDEGVDVIPSDKGLEGADNDLASVPVEERFEQLRAFIDEDLQEYDAVLLDLPGKESNIAINGLVAAENVVAPLKPGEFELRQLDRLPTILEENAAESSIDPELVMIIPTMVDLRKTLHGEFLAELNDEYPHLVAPSAVNDAADIEDAPAQGRTVFAADDDELYDTGQRARDAYQTNASELYNRLS